MNQRVLSAILIAVIFVFVHACKGGKEQEQKGAPQQKQRTYSLLYKPHDSYELLPEQTIILMEESADEANNLCLSAVTKKLDLDRISGISFDVIFNPEYVSYETYRAGPFEGNDKTGFTIDPKEGEKGKFGVKISFKPGTAKSTGKDKLISLCFKALKDGNITLALENGEILDTQKNKMAGITWVGGALWILP